MKNKQRVIDTVNYDVRWIETYLKKAEKLSAENKEHASEYWFEAYRQQLAVYQSKIDLLEVMGYNVLCDNLSYRVVDIVEKEGKKC